SSLITHHSSLITHHSSLITHHSSLASYTQPAMAPPSATAQRVDEQRHSGPINVGMLGFGVVGGGVARLLSQKSAAIATEIDRLVVLRRVLVRDRSRPRSIPLPDDQLTTDAGAVLDDPEIDVVVEVMGGIDPAADYIRRAIRNHKHVVTANKEVMAT